MPRWYAKGSSLRIKPDTSESRWTLENMAYKWSPTTRLRPGVPTRLAYALGDLYIAKLSRSKNLFVTVELPQGTDGRRVYSESEVTEIMSYLAKDAMYAYPVMGYPQTIMRAHESAAGLGISASMLYDNIIKGLVERSDPSLAGYIRDSAILDEAVSKGSWEAGPDGRRCGGRVHWP